VYQNQVQSDLKQLNRKTLHDKNSRATNTFLALTNSYSPFDASVLAFFLKIYPS
jgi:hypothetical protein